MALPETFVELALAGYRHKGASRCSCGARIEWFITPHLRNMPFSSKAVVLVNDEAIRAITSDTRLEPHHAVCPHVERFRRRKGKR